MAAPADGNCKKDKAARYLDGAQPNFSVAIVGDGPGLIRQHCGDLVVWVDGSFPPTCGHSPRPDTIPKAELQQATPLATIQGSSPRA